jgi:hypothetical protein
MDTNILSQYWLLVGEYSSPDFDESFDEVLTVKLQTPDRAIQLLAIHDWTPDYTEKQLEEMGVGLETIKENWPGISVPNRFEFSEDVFVEPPYLEELRVGSPDPFDEDFPIAIGEGQETEIKTIVEKGSKLLKIVERAKPHWDFVSVAMAYRGAVCFGLRQSVFESAKPLYWQAADFIPKILGE